MGYEHNQEGGKTNQKDSKGRKIPTEILKIQLLLYKYIIWTHHCLTYLILYRNKFRVSYFTHRIIAVHVWKSLEFLSLSKLLHVPKTDPHMHYQT